VTLAATTRPIRFSGTFAPRLPYFAADPYANSSIEVARNKTGGGKRETKKDRRRLVALIIAPRVIAILIDVRTHRRGQRCDRGAFTDSGPAARSGEREGERDGVPNAEENPGTLTFRGVWVRSPTDEDQMT